ncbi:MAG TPA: hypothetical protein PLT65_04630 [Bacilli bacterium]|nr:hypothetical protein [Bacilli bacterium]
MKEFFKWLGVNEKIAKVVIWILILMAFLIMTNAMLESIGAPYYKITIENLSNIKYSKILDYLCAWLMTALNFLSIVLLVFRVKETKKILKYVLLYMVLNYLVMKIADYAVLQAFIAVYILLFCFFYSGKNWKYIFYGLGSLILNTGLQYIWYLYKARFIEYSNITSINKTIMGIDFYIIMALVILAKEVFLNKRRDK